MKLDYSKLITKKVDINHHKIILSMVYDKRIDFELNYDKDLDKMFLFFGGICISKGNKQDLAIIKQLDKDFDKNKFKNYPNDSLLTLFRESMHSYRIFANFI